MPKPIDRRGRLMPEAEFEEQKEREREDRLRRFTQRAGGLAPTGTNREVIPLDLDEPEWQPPSTRSHDPHTLEAARARLVEAMNSRG